MLRLSAPILLRRPILAVAAFLAVFSGGLTGQNSGPAPSGKLKLDTGEEIFRGGCISCHGPDGKGQPQNIAGFEKPDTFPDFSDCPTSTPEADVQWRAIITNGGTAKSFSQIMPSFKDLLTPQQIDKVIAYLRGFCTEQTWPRGDLNLPRAFITEKAFPEDESVVTTTLNTQGAPGVGSAVVYEKRVGARGQIEANVPYNFAHDSGAWQSGFGDLTLGYKHVLFHSLKTGSIFSLLGEVTAPTGDSIKGTGSGTTIFETSAAFGQLFPKDAFIQVHTGAELPAHTNVAPQAYYLRTALGKTFATDHGLGRRWTPMAEFIYDRDLVKGAPNNWTIVPELQIPLSKRLHVLGGIGYAIPANHTEDRQRQAMFYVLWDFADGKLTEGW
jgi:mono/diheme cytochrome c family protein